MNDPHNLQNTNGTSTAATNSQHSFYSQQMLLQQQYMQMPTLYGGQQMLSHHQMDMQTFQQQQQLLRAMEQQQQQLQQQQALQTQCSLPQRDPQQLLVQQQALQQQQYQRALQQAAQQQQQQRQLEQQRLMEQQQRQLDRMHQEREAARLQQQQHEEMLRQKAEEAARQQREEAARLEREEMQRRLALQKEQQLRQQREAHERMLQEQERLKEEQRKQEEAQKAAEETRRREEEERREMEKVMAVREEQKRKQKEALEAHTAMQEKANSFAVPMHLAGCHSLTKLVSHMPFPSPFIPQSDFLKVNVHPSAASLLTLSDPELAHEIATAMAQVDVAEVLLKHVEGESNEANLAAFPPLLQTIYSIDPTAFDVEPRPVVIPEIPSTSEQTIQLETLSPAIPVVEQSDAELKSPQSAAEETRLLPETAAEAAAVLSAAASVEPSTSTELETITEETAVAEVSPPVAAPPEQLSVPPVVATPADPPRPTALQDPDQTQLRKQIVSLGKQPKAQQARKKKDMVESLYDSLTGYFDVSEGRRRRQKTKTFEEEQHEKMQMEMIAQMEMAEATEKTKTEKVVESEHRPDHAGPSKEEAAEDSDGKMKFFETNKRMRKRNREKTPEQPERPPTPTEIIHQRETEWRERQRKRQEKHKRRQNDSESDCWNNEVMAEKESYAKFTSIIDQIFDNVEDLDIVGGAEDDDAEIPQELMIDKLQLEELRREAQKLKSWKRINKVHPDRLVKLLTILEKNIRDVITVEGSQPLIPFFDEGDDDDSDETYRELVDDRILRAADASCTAMIIMTSAKMSKQVFIEDTIDRSIQLCKQFLKSIIYPASDGLCRSPTKLKKANEEKRRRKMLSHARSQTVQKVYSRMAELIDCFAELVRSQSLTDTAVLQLCTLAAEPFFVDNIGELQMQSIKLLSAIFSRYEEYRKSILQDLLNSLHRLPPTKNVKNSYRMSAEDWVSNLTVLIMQLVQSTVKIPRRRRSEDCQTSMDSPEEPSNPDAVVKDSFNESQKVATMFLSGFLGKCTAKSEEDYRRLFDQFLHDLLAALYKPEWPAAEMMLTLLGNLLVNSYRSKSMDMSLRVASLDYLGTIAARMRKDVQQACSDEVRLDMVVRTIMYDELDDRDEDCDVDKIDITHLSGADKMRKVERALIDYLIEKKGDSDVSIEYAIMFYVGEWYREVYEESESAKQKLKIALNSTELNDKEKRKFEKKTEKVLERCQTMKDFLIKTADKRQLRKRAEQIARTGKILIDSDAMWLVKYLASSREFSQSFSTYLKHILYGIHVEQTVGLRTKAMRCLTLIIESDHDVLLIPEVHKAVQARMMDPNAAVREATIELVGKYVIAKPDFVPQYYPILIERIKDSGVAVRKRVIRIMREMCERQADFEKTPEMLAKIVRRISDEEGVKKLTIETFQALWFQPTRERDSAALITKVMTMTNMVQVCMKEGTVEFFEQLLSNLLKGGDRSLLCASRQMVDTLVDNVLTLDSKIASEESQVNGSVEETVSLSTAAAHANHQERLLACLTTLSLFSKVRPDLMVKHAETLQPYLSMNVSGPREQQVMDQVINMLERVVPLMDHPSESFLNTLDESLCALVKDGGMRIIASALACISAIYNKWKKRRPAVILRFLTYLKFLNQVKDDVEHKQGNVIPHDKGPVIQRALYSVGLMSRYFDVDAILEGDKEAEANLSAQCCPNRGGKETNHERFGELDEADGDESSREVKPFTEDVFQVLSLFCRNRDGSIRMKALTALGNFTATHSNYLLRREMRNMYMTLLSYDDREYLSLKIQTLKNLELFLTAEEQKLVKNNDEWQKAKEGQDLKEMELANSGLASTIIQVYWNATLNSYYSPIDAVRTAAVQVAMLTLSQGLVTPGSSIPTLIAMSTDSIVAVRNKVGNTLRDIDTKYAGMVPSKAVSGIRCSFRLQKHLKKDPNSVVRGIRVCEQSSMAEGKVRLEHGVPKMSNDGQAILSGLYQSLRVNRQQRRSFLSSVLRLFSEDCREKLSLEEWVFVADNIAMFPYQVLDEPLYVIHQIESIVSISGQNIINNFKSHLMPRPNASEADDDVEFDAELIYRRLPEDKSLLYECMKNSQACFLLLYLKNYLMKLYSFSEAKVQEYSPSEAAKVYEKALSTRKNVMMFYPQTALEELRPEANHQRDTINGHINMANQIVYFRNMLLSLDRLEEEDGETEGATVPPVKESDVEEEEEEPAAMDVAPSSFHEDVNDTELNEAE